MPEVGMGPLLIAGTLAVCVVTAGLIFAAEGRPTRAGDAPVTISPGPDRLPLEVCLDIEAVPSTRTGRPAYGLGAKLGAPGFRYGFNASNRYSISAMSSPVSFNSEKMGDAGTVLPGP